MRHFKSTKGELLHAAVFLVLGFAGGCLFMKGLGILQETHDWVAGLAFDQLRETQDIMETRAGGLVVDAKFVNDVSAFMKLYPEGASFDYQVKETDSLLFLKDNEKWEAYILDLNHYRKFRETDVLRH